MMWMTSKPIEAAWEPVELRDLKIKLSKLSCKCLSDRIKPVISAENQAQIVSTQNDKEVQAENPTKMPSVDRFNQVYSGAPCKDRRDFMYSQAQDALCPGCFITMNLLRGGPYKILKDEESETKSEMFSRDKWTEKRVKSVERTTSVTSKPVVKYSNLTLCDFISECSNDLSIEQNELKHNPQVKFVDAPININDHETAISGTCFCLENFMDTIRPPILDAYYL